MRWVVLAAVLLVFSLTYALVSTRAQSERQWRESSMYGVDAVKAEMLLWEHLSGEQFEEFEQKWNSGQWTLEPTPNPRVWSAGPYEIDLGAQTVVG